MLNQSHLLQRDSKHVWHPASLLKSDPAPLVIEKARGSYLYTNEGPLIDAISSWWCKSLGHAHPAVIDAIQTQLGAFEHVIGANTTHPPMVALAEMLHQISGLQHVFFASDGSSAVEIALKMARQAMQLRGLSHRTGFIALQGGYHGETLGALSVGDLSQYKQAFKTTPLDCHWISPKPYVSGMNDPLWLNAYDPWSDVLAQLNLLKDTTCAIIVEPLILGASGMHCYSADFLKRLHRWAKEHDVYFIADEIMTGIGRTGTWLACDHAQIKPDLVCLSKGLTSGTMPLSTVLVDHPIFELFEQAPASLSFLHSHTYSGHALGVVAALTTLQTIQQEHLFSYSKMLSTHMLNVFQSIAQKTNAITNIRSLGVMVAGDVCHQNAGIMQKITEHARANGALLRPIGNTLYWLPPLNTTLETIDQLGDITLKSIIQALNQGVS